MSLDDDPSEEEMSLFHDLAEQLRVAHRRVAVMSPESERQVMLRRLLAITDSAKHDLGRASRRLDSLLAELPVPAEDTAEAERPG